MPTLNLKDVTKYVEQNIGTFHTKRLEKLEKLNFREVLKRKNPYLFKAKNILTAQDLVKNLLDAYLQSQEETTFKEFWQLISDSDTLYTDIIEPLGHQAKEKNEEFLKAYAKVINQFTLKFAQDFCDDGVINWQKIVEFNSKKKPKVVKTTKPKAKKPSAKR